MNKKLMRLALTGVLAVVVAACGSSPSASRRTTTTGTAPTTTSSVPPPTTTSVPPLPATTVPPPPASTVPSTRSVPPPPLPFGTVTTRLPTSARVVALTFDAGANADGLPSILATLRAANLRATFFVTGAFATHYPALVGEVVRAGHLMGDHSVDHPHFTQLSNAQIDVEVLGAAETIRQVSGVSPAALFRFPYGDSDARTLAEVNALGYAAVGWTVDTLGWEGTSGGITAGSVLGRVMAALQPGEIVLMHVGSNPTDGSTLDADALPRVIAEIAAAGYSFVTLSAS